MIRRIPFRQHQKGFTIIELIIATAVLSTMLLLVSVLLINVGKLYYKGLNQSRVQNSVRTINDSVSQQLQLSDKVPQQEQFPAATANTHAYCIGDKRYTYVLGVQVGHTALDGAGNPTGPIYNHVLWQDTNPAPGSCFIDAAHSSRPVNLTASGPASNDATAKELAAPNSRLTAFCIGTPTATPCVPGISPYSLTISEAIGDSDLLSHATPFVNSFNTVCSGGSGDQFCSTAHLQTSVWQRL